MRNGATAYKPPRLFYVRSTAVEQHVGLMFSSMWNIGSRK